MKKTSKKEPSIRKLQEAIRERTRPTEEWVPQIEFSEMKFTEQLKVWNQSLLTIAIKLIQFQNSLFWSFEIRKGD